MKGAAVPLKNAQAGRADRLGARKSGVRGARCESLSMGRRNPRAYLARKPVGETSLPLRLEVNEHPAG